MIQTRLSLITAFVCLLLWLRLNPLSRVPSVSSSSYLRLPSLLLPLPSYCPRIASPSPLPFDQPLSAVSLLRPPLPRGGSFTATTTTWRFFRSFHYHHSDPPPCLSFPLTFSSSTAATHTTIEGYLFL